MLALATAAVVVATGCGAGAASPTIATPRGAGLVELVDEGADVALDADVAAMARSPHFEDFVAAVLAPPEGVARDEARWLEGLLRRTDRLVGAGFLTTGDALETVTILGGRYGDEDVRQITREEPDLREERREGVRAFYRAGSGVAFVGDHAIVVGTEGRVRAVLGRLGARGSRRGGDAAAALAAMERLPGSELGVFVRVDSRVRRLLAEMLEAEGDGDLRSVALEADLDGGLALRVVLAAGTERFAEALVLEVERRLAHLHGSALLHVLGLSGAVRDARAERSGSLVVVRAALDGDGLRAALGAAHALAIELETPAP